MKFYFSNKHKKYCVKKEFAHLVDGRVCYVSKYYPGSKHDLSIFLENVDYYKDLLKKRNGDEGDIYWSLITDKGYEGAFNYIPTISPKKGKNLPSSDARENFKISSARIICENFYDRMKVLWGAARLNIRNNLNIYDNIIDICASLINFHISSHPLRNNENQQHRRSISSTPR